MNDLTTSRPLREIAEDLAEILQADEWTDGQVEALDRLTLTLEAKAGNIAEVIRRCEARADEINAEIDRLTAWKRSLDGKADWLKRYLLAAMKQVDRTEIETASFRLRIQKNPPAATATDDTLTPPKYLLIIPETVRPDKRQILDALKRGEPVTGWSLSQGERLVIR